eukprot:523785-Pelagomonas_calceolata.AAC.3
MMCRVTSTFLFGFLELQDLSLVNVPVVRRDPRRIKVSLYAWDRSHKDMIRAALVPSRGASTSRKTQSGIAREVSGFNRTAYSVPASV